MALCVRTVWILRRYWTNRLGVAVDAFEEPGVTVGPADEGGVQLFRHDESVVIGAPTALLNSVERESDAALELDIDDAGAIREWFDAVGVNGAVLGPAFYGYTDREVFDPVDGDARALAAGDRPSYDTFRVAIPDDEWEHGGSSLTPGQTVGLFLGNDLVAVAGYEVWNDLLAHIAVVTHPNHRNSGHGRAVVSLATEQALSAGLVPQYRTLEAWPWSVALARQLGFERFATASLGIYNSS